MRSLLEHHTDLAILLILFVEELGIPMPIPSDIVILYVGYRLRTHSVNPVTTIGLLFLTANLGAFLLFALVRQGGRPMVERFGPYLHLDARRLARAESWLNRLGMWGILAGRALPGIRLATVIAAGALRVAPRVFVPAQLGGTLIYMLTFLLLGYTVGPAVAERLHLPALSVQLVFLVVVVVGLPILLRSVNRASAADDTRAIQAGLRSRQRLAAALLAGCVGLVEWTSFSAIVATVTHVVLGARNPAATARFATWFGIDQVADAAALADTLDYLAAALLALVAVVVFFELFMPMLHIPADRLGRQTLALWLTTFSVSVLVAVLVGLSYAVRRAGLRAVPLDARAVPAVVVIALGLLSHAYVTAEARRLLIDRFADPRAEATSQAAPAATVAE